MLGSCSLCLRLSARSSPGRPWRSTRTMSLLFNIRSVSPTRLLYALCSSAPSLPLLALASCCTTGQLELVGKSTCDSCSRNLQELLSLSKNENEKRSLPHGPLFYPYLCLLVPTSTALDNREIKKG